MNHTRPVLTVHVHAPQPELEQVRKRRRTLFLTREAAIAALAIVVFLQLGPLAHKPLAAAILLILLISAAATDAWRTASHSG